MLSGLGKEAVILEMMEEELDGLWREHDEGWCRKRGAMFSSTPVWSVAVS